MFVQPYLFFEGRADEALAFYQEAVGATLEMLMRYKESPDKSNLPPNSEEKVMHMAFRVGDTVLLGSDGMCSTHTNFQGFSLTLSAANAEEAESVFTKLADGGQVTMPLTETFFSPRFGMLTDRFGLGWMVLVEQ